MTTRLLKRTVASTLSTGIGLLRPAEKLRQLWHFARLQADLGCRIPSSIVVLGNTFVHGSGNIRLGEDLYLYPDLHLETQAAGRISIGSRVVISRGTHIVAFDEIEIGNGAMIGEYVSIRDANHIFGDMRPLRDSGHVASPIKVGANAWIGRGCAVLAGVTVGDHAVVGANSVVTRDVPAGAVVAGAPARPVSTRRVA